MATKKYESIDYLRLLLASATLILTYFIYVYITEKELYEGLKDLTIGVIPNIVAFLFVFIIGYLLLTKYGLSPQDKLKDEIVDGLATVISDANLPPETKQVASLLDHLSDKMPFYTVSYANKAFSLEEKLINAKTVDILGYSCVNLIRNFSTLFAEALARGVNFRIMLVDTNKEASKMFSKNPYFKINSSDVKRAIERLEKIENDAQKIRNQSKAKNKNIGNIELQLINWIPSISLIIIDKDKNTGSLKVKVNALFSDTPPDRNPNKIVEKKISPIWFDYFTNQFELLWSNKFLLD